jgi:hypothetical protein
MSVAAHNSPRAQVRDDLRDRFRELSRAVVERVDTEAIATDELDADNQHKHLWANVPVITMPALNDVIRGVFDAPLPAPSEHAADVATPATVFVAAVCPRCAIPQQIPLVIGVKLEQDDSTVTLHLKGKSKPAIHQCGQMRLPETPRTDGQEPLPFEAPLGPLPTLAEINGVLEQLTEEDSYRYGAALMDRVEELPDDEIEAWDDATKREVLAWAQALHQSSENTMVIVPPLPVVLGGEAALEAPTARELLDAIREVVDEVPIEHQPNFDTIGTWSDTTRREVMAWAVAIKADLAAGADSEVAVPPLPIVLGGAQVEDSIEETAAPDETDDDSDDLLP